MKLPRLLRLSVSAVLCAACGNSDAADHPPGAAAQSAVDERPPQATLPAKLCDLVPQADAERIMGKALAAKRNDEWGCEYQDARGTTGTGLTIFRNVVAVGDQCRVTPQSEPLSGVGDEACIAVKIPAGLYTTVVFSAGGQTFEVVAPGEDRASERSTAIAKVILSKLGS